MNPFRYIHIPSFALSFLFGIIAVYIYNNDQMRKIYVFPTPENIEKLQYRDAANNCFEFTQKEISCTDNSSLKKIPIQS